MANIQRYIIANDVINRAAVEVGLSAVTDVYASYDPNFIALRYLLDSCGQELVQECDWNIATRVHEFTTADGDTGEYLLPLDFSHMIDQSGWQQGVPGSAYPLLGPASVQWWSYLVASELTSVSIYMWFRIKENRFCLWPQPPPVGIPIRYEYASRAWVLAGDEEEPTYRDKSLIPADIIIYDPVLIVKKLKLAWLQAKGFDSTKAEDEYQTVLDQLRGKDKSAPILDLRGSRSYFRYLNSVSNIPETGFGS